MIREPERTANTYGIKYHLYHFRKRKDQYWKQSLFLNLFANWLRFYVKWTCILLGPACKQFGYSNHSVRTHRFFSSKSLITNVKKFSFDGYTLTKSASPCTRCKQNPENMLIKVDINCFISTIVGWRGSSWKTCKPPLNLLHFLFLCSFWEKRIISWHTCSRFDVPPSGESRGVFDLLYFRFRMSLDMNLKNSRAYSWPDT